MSTAEITAYLAGVQVGRRADLEHVPPESVVFEVKADPSDELFRSWQRLGDKQFRYWIYRGVWEAWKQ